jgi:integrase
MDTRKIDYARDFFTELVVAKTIRASHSPSSSETAELAEKAIKMAQLFSAARQQIGIAPQISEHRQTATLGSESIPSSGITFAQLAREFGGRVAKKSVGNNGRDFLSRLERNVIPHLGSKAAAEIEPREILSVLRTVEETGFPAKAYQIYKDIRRMYRYAIVAGLSKQDPTAHLRSALNKPLHKPRAALIDAASIGELLLALRDYKGTKRSTARFMFRLAPMLFLRPKELRTLEWKTVDLDAATLVVAADRMKTRRPHVVPLARQAVRIFRDVHKITGYRRYVFNNGNGPDQPLCEGGFHAMLGTIGYGKVVTAHGLRAMASTWLNEQG